MIVAVHNEGNAQSSHSLLLTHWNSEREREREREREEADGDDILIHHSLNLLTSVSPPSSSSPMDTSSEWSVSLMTGQVCCNEASLLSPTDTPRHPSASTPTATVTRILGFKSCQKEFHESFQWPEIEISMNSFPLYFSSVVTNSMKDGQREEARRRATSIPIRFSSLILRVI